MPLPVDAARPRRPAEALRKTYPDLDEFWADLTHAYRDEIRDLYQAGCRYLQIDDTTIAMMCDPKVREHGHASSATIRNGHRDRYADAGQRRAARRPARRDGLRPHVPRQLQEHVDGERRATTRSRRPSSRGLDVDGFFLEYDTDRAGGFEPLRFVPKGKKVVLGLISSKVAALESKDDLKRRIEAAAKYVPLENLCI